MENGNYSAVHLRSLGFKWSRGEWILVSDLTRKCIGAIKTTKNQDGGAVVVARGICAQGRHENGKFVLFKRIDVKKQHTQQAKPVAVSLMCDDEDDEWE